MTRGHVDLAVVLFSHSGPVYKCQDLLVYLLTVQQAFFGTIIWSVWLFKFLQ